MPGEKQLPYLLTVLSGPNAGARVPLSGKTVTVAAAPEADIELDALAAGPVRLAFSRERVKVMPGGHGVTTLDGKAVPGGSARVMVMPVTLRLDDETEILLCRTVPARSRPMVSFGAGFGLAVACFGVVAAALTLNEAPGARQGAELAAASLVPQTAVAATLDSPVSVPLRKTPPSRTEIVATLEQMIADSGLAGLQVSTDGEVIRVSGHYLPEQADAWLALRESYDGRFGAAVPLLVDVTESDIGAPLAVASVWLGENPEVVTRTGDVLKLGDEAPGGWTIARIEAGAVHLARGKQTIVIEF